MKLRGKIVCSSSAQTPVINGPAMTNETVFHHKRFQKFVDLLTRSVNDAFFKIMAFVCEARKKF